MINACVWLLPAADSLMPLPVRLWVCNGQVVGLYHCHWNLKNTMYVISSWNFTVGCRIPLNLYPCYHACLLISTYSLGQSLSIPLSYVVIVFPHLFLSIWRKWRCLECGLTYTSAEALEQHMATTTHNFPCPHCDKVHTSNRLLRRHLLTHVNGKIMA